MTRLRDFLDAPEQSDSPALKTSAIAVGVVVFGQAALIYAAGSPWPIAYLWSLASLASGGALGFLFGVPKVLQDQSQMSAGYRQVVNTNLDQISDWLTKVVVGLSLVNAKTLLTSLRDTADILAKALGGRAGDLALAIAVIVYFSIVGFLTIYILTRLYLSRAFYEGDQPPGSYKRLHQLVLDSDLAEKEGRSEEARTLRARVIDEVRTVPPAKRDDVAKS